MLKRLRLILGIISLLLFTFLFIDFAGLLPAEKIPLADIQFLPALLALSFGTVAALLLLTLLFGRIYCSVLCPMGLFQDLTGRVSRIFKKRRKYQYSPEKRWLRYGTLVTVVGTYVAGWSVILSLLEPYSAFGRMATHLLRPIYMAGNNLLADVFNHFGNYSFYNAEVFLLGTSSLVVALLTFVIIGYLAWRYGRTFCNTLCPVGTVLGFVSRFSMFRFNVNEATCNQCGLCARSCKVSCIDSKSETVDNSRCVTCFNCTTVCTKKAIRYEFSWKKSSPAQKTEMPSEEESVASRRRFLTTVGVTMLAAGTQVWAKGMHLGTNKPWVRKSPLSPPGSHSIEHLNAHCTACHLCVAQCPSRILKPSFLEYGVEGMMQPVMDFSHGFCNFDCTLCTEVCPNGALKKLTMDEKHSTQMGFVNFIKTNCVVYTDETFCGACSEHCPTQAVSMVPYKGDLTIPQINTAICVGCGGCEYVCPAKPAKAIYVEGNPVHRKAQPFVDNAKKEVKVDSFGF
ncbi:MAG TPA: 4Fe-4S dicluster domain-containing protein [Bacteroidales bacterium]|nr:4Fe-4S dicluster domain-containing protein [Bacteroidales bacterium]